MKYRQANYKFLVVAIIFHGCLLLEGGAALQTNSWKISTGGKWETSANWSLNLAPATTQSAVLITNASAKTVTNDATTVSSSPGSMTISNLVLSSVSGATNILLLNSAGTATPLRILNCVTISNGATLQITNSAFQVDAISGGGINGAGVTIDGIVNLNLGSIFTATNAPTTIGLVKTGQVTLAGGRILASELDLALNLGSAGSLSVVSGQMTITPGEFNMIGIGEGGVGRMIVSNASIVAPLIDIGYSGDSQGTLTIASGASIIASNLIVGDSGTGTVFMSSGALYVTNSATFIGNIASGQMILSGGTFTTTELDLGNMMGSVGTLTVTGGSLILPTDDFSSGTIYVGNDGVGRMTVSNGTVLGQGITVGLGSFDSPQGTLTVAGGSITLLSSLDIGVNNMSAGGASGTVWITGGQLSIASGAINLLGIGEGGVGQMTVSNGTVAIPILEIGQYVDSQGTLTILGGSTVASSNVVVGDAGTGTLWVASGRFIATNAATIVGNGGGGVGRIILSNGTFLAQAIGLAGYAGSLGTLTVVGGTNALVGPLTVGSTEGGSGIIVISGAQLVITNTPTTIAGGSGFIVDGNAMLNAGAIVATNVTTKIGNLGNGVLSISGGLFRGRDVIVGNAAGSQGSINVSGGATIITSNLVIGNCGVNAMGAVFVGGQMYITNAAHAAFLDVRSGTLTVGAGGVLVTDKLVATNACGRVFRLGGILSATTTNLDPNLSATGDGIRNAWKQQFRIDPFDPTAANLDSDGDGFSNLQEFLAGTDPTNSSSAFRITTITREGYDVRISWMTGLGKTNALQRTASGTGGLTASFGDIFVVTNTASSVTNYLDIGAATNSLTRIYRVRLVP